MLWARRAELVDQINAAHVNPDYLPSFTLPDRLQATASMAEAVEHADVVIIAAPSHGFRDVARDAPQYLRPWVPIVSLTKGIERSTLMRMTEVAAEEMPGRPVGVMTGPNLAKEIMAGQPAASVVAIPDATIAARAPADPHPAEPAGVHEPRRGRLRGRRRREERDRDRRRHGRGDGVR